jgi:two-component system sensor histidine kinase DegS
LRPATLDELGVGPAVEALVRQASEASSAEIKGNVRLAYDEGRATTRLSPDLEAVIYRLVQESLNNALKHAAPESVEVEVVEEEQKVNLSVKDDGTGFDPSAASDRFGLIGMRERVGLVGGELSIESEPGEGTVVRAELPVVRAVAESQPVPGSASPD